MSIRWKVIILLSVVSTLFTATSYLAQQWVVLPGFMQAERAEAKDDLGRCLDGLRRDCEHLAKFVQDWAAWDDTYRYVQDRNQAYTTANLNTTTFTNSQLNMIVVARPNGEMTWGEIRDFKKGEIISAPEVLQIVCSPANKLVGHHEPDDHVTGLLMTKLGPMLVSSHAIVTSDNKGPVRGAFILGHFLDKGAIEELAARTHVAMNMWPIDGASVPAQDRAALAMLTPKDATWLKEDDPKVLRGYAVIRDIYDKPAMLMRADLPRTISQRGIAATHLATGCGIVGGATILVLMWVLLRRTVINPLMTLTDHAVRVGKEGYLQARLNLRRNDEIGTLGREFDRMVVNLTESRAQLVGMARRAGMAEVATDVLHNVGNVLNSVNVSANLVAERLRKSEAPGVGQAAQIMLEHREELGQFITTDERGKQLPGYLAELGKFLVEEQDALLGEMKSLTDAVEHIKQIVNLQQAHTKSQAITEITEPADLLEEAIRLHFDSFDRHHIKVVREFAPTGPVYLERHRILQILNNLISNAKDALKESNQVDRQIIFRLETTRGEEVDRLRISVSDNGVGIAPGNLPRIFNFGFSTRPDGHGFGLHSAANMARQMGGALLGASDGPGKGAEFTIELPIVRQQVTA